MTAAAHSNSTQAEQILADLIAGKRITQRDAERHYGCGRLGARIYELKEEHPEIQSETIAIKKRNGRTAYVSRYFIPRDLS